MSGSSREGLFLISDKSFSLPCGLTSLDFGEDEFEGRRGFETPVCTGYIPSHPVTLLGMKSTPDAVVLVINCRKHEAVLPNGADDSVDISVAYLPGLFHVIEPWVVFRCTGETKALSGFLLITAAIPEWCWDS